MTVEVPSPFLPGTTIRWVWDSTSLKALKFCPRYYKYTMIDGWTPRVGGIHLVFGQLYHKALEDFRRGTEAGGDPEVLLREVVRGALVGSVGMGEDKGKNRESLVRSIIWYVDRWRSDPLETVVLPSGASALEMSFQWQSNEPIMDMDYRPLSFRYPQLNPEDKSYLFCGHFDRLARYQGMALIPDYKTTGKTLGTNYFDQFTPDTQMSFYPFMGHKLYGIPVRGVLIDAVQVAITFSDYGRHIAYRTPAMLEEWWEETLGWLRQQVTFSNEDFWPMNDTACRTCHFKAICRKDPSVRGAFLESHYDKKEPWNPLATRTPGEAIDLSE